MDDPCRQAHYYFEQKIHVTDFSSPKFAFFFCEFSFRIPRTLRLILIPHNLPYKLTSFVSRFHIFITFTHIDKSSWQVGRHSQKFETVPKITNESKPILNAICCKTSGRYLQQNWRTLLPNSLHNRYTFGCVLQIIPIWNMCY